MIFVRISPTSTNVFVTILWSIGKAIREKQTKQRGSATITLREGGGGVGKECGNFCFEMLLDSRASE